MALYDKITTCSLAMRYAKGDKDQAHASAYTEVLKLLPENKVTEHSNANLTHAAVEFVKMGFATPTATDDTKARVAVCVAIIKASDEMKEDGLSRQICHRFCGINDFDRRIMSRLFNFSVCDDRVRALLDKAMLLKTKTKTKNIASAIDHEFHVEFVTLFFNVMDRIVMRGDSLKKLGYSYSSDVTYTQMMSARELIVKHVSSIAEAYSSCFKLGSFKKPRVPNNLFPANGAFPCVSFGCATIDFDYATIATLLDSLLETEEKQAFIETMLAIVSHASKKPAVTYSEIKLESAKKFFLDTVLKKSEADQVRESTPELWSQPRLLKEYFSQKEAGLALKIGYDTLGDKYLKLCTKYSDERHADDAVDRRRLKEEVHNLKSQLVRERNKRHADRDSGDSDFKGFDKFDLIKRRC